MHEADNMGLHSMITEWNGKNIPGHLKMQNKSNAEELIILESEQYSALSLCVCKTIWKLDNTPR